MAAAIQSNDCDANGEAFATTHWSVVRLASNLSSPAAAGALEKLCRTYWSPVYAFVRRRGSSPHDAQDLTQEFFCRLLQKNNALAKADPAKGRFRSYLLGALNHFLLDEWDKSRAEKRGGRINLFSLDALEPEARRALEPATELSPEKIFDRRWAMVLLEQALQRLREEFKAAGKSAHFDLLKPFLTNDAGPGGYDAVATQLELSPQAVAVAVHRLRQRYRDAVRAEVAHTVSAPDQIEDELRSLFQ